MAHQAILSNARLNAHTRPHKKAVNGAQRSVATPLLQQKLIQDLEKAEAKREEIKAHTFRVYVYKLKDASFGLPFVSLSDEAALAATKEILKTFTVTGIGDLYSVGEYCTINGKLTAHKPSIVLE